MKETEVLAHVTHEFWTSRLYELHESKLTFLSRIEFIRSKFSIFLLMYPGPLSPERSRSAADLSNPTPSGKRHLFLPVYLTS